VGEQEARELRAEDANMSGLPLDLAAWPGYVLAILAVVVAYRLGTAVGARRAHRLWTRWTGISPAELQGRAFDRQLRHLRGAIGRPADSWPAHSRED
jgi:hypothetical protein